jgi:hypothetical protein
MSIEEPTFTTTLQDGPFEVREYPALIAAEVRVAGERNAAASAGFRQLAAYIFGANTTKKSIAMTAPVVQARAPTETIATNAPSVRTHSADEWTVRFLMPRAYSIESLPTPNDPGIELKTLPPSRFAVVKFSGLARSRDVARKITELRAFASAHRLQPENTSSLARYNPPWTLWFMRRNEVLIPLPAATVH